MSPQRPTNPPRYSTDEIEVLEGLEPVRRRPGMYIGDLAERPTRVLESFVGSAIAHARPALDPRIVVTIEDERTVSVEDFGAGWPLEPTTRHLSSYPVEVLTQLSHGSRLLRQRDFVTADLAAAQALCWKVQADIRREGRHWWIRYRQGRLLTPLAEVGPASRTGTRLAFTLDNAFAKADARYDLSTVTPVLERFALLFPEHRFHLLDRSTSQTRELFFPGGPKDCVREQTEDPIRIGAARRPGLRLDLAWAGAESPRRVVVCGLWVAEAMLTIREWLAYRHPDLAVAVVVHADFDELRRRDELTAVGLDPHTVWSLVERAFSRSRRGRRPR